MSVEQPTSLKNILKRSFAQDGTGLVSPKFFDNDTSPYSANRKRIIFALCLFNAVVLERKNYGTLS